MQSYDIIIIGNGITGLSTAWHLDKIGIKNIAIIDSHSNWNQSSSINAGYATASLLDNVTRISHLAGPECARDLLRLNLNGFSNLLDLLNNFKIEFSRGETLRIANTKHEFFESQTATMWLSSNGFPSSGTNKYAKYFQLDGTSAMSFNSTELLKKLADRSKFEFIKQEVTSYRSESNGIILNFKNGSNTRSQMVVCACHLGIKSLIPQISASIVPYVDQWCEFSCDPKSLPFQRGSFILTKHSQIWMSYTQRGTLVVGGGKYLRKWEGIDTQQELYKNEIEAHLKMTAEELFQIKMNPTGRKKSQIDIRMCDELPLIGPLFGESRIILSTGYMGTGITLGIAAGIEISKFIATGNLNRTLRNFLPLRFRNLPDFIDT